MADFFVVTALSAAVIVLIQSLTFAVGHRIGRYNVVDVAWGAGLAVVALVAAIIGDGDGTRRVLLALIVGAWGLRLSLHMWRKSAGKGEDPRYTQMLQAHGGSRITTVITRIFAVQALAQWVISLPVQVAAVTGPVRTSGAWLVLVGAIVAVGGLIFEAVGDHQLRAFKADSAHRGMIMDRGLWAWTRHPNYFGDACVWWGVYLIAAATWPGAATIIAPIAMTYFLVVGTGARVLERHMADRPGYREYQQRTSFFIPRPPKV